MNPAAGFRETRPEVLHDLIRAYPFATLVHGAGGALEAEHLPLLLRTDDAVARLEGHVTRASPLVAGLDGCDVLVVFRGPQSYVSPNWYPSKAAHGKAVPTWNYVTVQARGKLRLIGDPAWKRAHLSALTAQHEAGAAHPWTLVDAPEDFIDRQFAGLVGVEISVSDLQGTVKLSQNKSAEDRAAVTAALSGSDDPEARRVGALMARSIPGQQVQDPKPEGDTPSGPPPPPHPE